MYKKTWWINPVVLYIFLLLLVFGAYKFGSASYQKLYGTEKGISTSYFILHIVCFLLFYLGYLLSKK